MYRVTIYPLSLDLIYTSYAWTGLFDLEVEGKVTVRLAMPTRADVGELNGQYENPRNLCVFYMSVEDSSTGQVRKIYVDLLDGEGIGSAGGLEDCDFYFKRAYRTSFLDTVMRFPQYRHKILPFGLYFPVSSYNQHSELRRALIAEIAFGLKLKRPKESIRRISHRLSTVIENLRRTNRFDDYSKNEKSQFEAPPDTPDVKRIVFLTRVFDIDEGWNALNRDYVIGLNEERAAIIRGMRRHFGTRFVGGLMSDPFSRQHYADCIAEVSTVRADYLRLLKESRVAVTTKGLVDSIPGKLAEYFAASRCVLTDPLLFELPYEVQHRKHVMVFGSVDEAITAGEELLRDDTLASHMRHENHRLYRESVEPSRTMLRCIETAFSRNITA
jgi:hypothetical protein